MNDKIHHFTGQPAYDDKFNWDSQEINHDASREDLPKPHPVVYDIETTAETPQRPIFLYAIDELDGRDFIAYDPAYLSDDFTDRPMEVKEYMKQQTDYNTTVFNYVGKEIMDKLINRISQFNDEHETNKTLVGHNIFFDNGIMGDPNPEILELDQYEEDEWDGAIAYNKYAVLHRRAGANGRLYKFVDGNIQQYVPITDTMVTAKAMRLSGSLEDLADDLGLKGYYEDENQQHGTLTKQYIDYALNDVETTLSVFNRLRVKLNQMFSTSMNLHQLYSAASIGKQKMREMGYDRVDYTPKSAAIPAEAFFGGQTESLKPGELVEGVTYLDYLSQYPTACKLTGVWDFKQGQKVRVKEISVEDLPKPDMEEFRKPNAWSQCADYYVRVQTKGAMLPIRVETNIDRNTKVMKGEVTTDVTTAKSDEITLNSDGDIEARETVGEDKNGVLYHYLDVLGAMFYDEDAEIEITEVYKMEAIGKQDLNSTEIGGTKIEKNANLMSRTIEERKRIQYKENNGEKDQRTLANKITANSLFGVSAERILQKHEVETEDSTEIVRYDQAGTYYNPHVGSTITAAGRLMLTLGEIIANRNGSELIYCDTDSLIIENEAVEEVMEWFNEYLNPYDGIAGEQDFLEIEDYEGTDLKDVKIYSVGVKKYVILDQNNKILMNKEHGLGHFEQLRNTEEDPNRTKKFWGTLLKEMDIVDGRIPRFTTPQMDKYVTWQTAASTENIRQQMDKLTDETVRYGDFIKRSINPQETGEIIQYIGLDLEDKAFKIIKEQGEVKSIELVEEMDKEHMKTVNDVLNDWMKRVNQNEQGRNKYKITGLRAVTKESSDLKRAWDDEQTGYFT